jgi:CubicO group peptidase (beta-lactamase class C family)
MKPGKAMHTPSKGTGFDPVRLERVGDHLERSYIAKGKIAGCQIGVARHGRVAYTRSFGQMDREQARQMADDGIFRLHSMTKPITSVALMTLHERGHFQLNDPVSRVVPSWKDHRVWVFGEGESMVTEAPARPITFRDLLRHTAGLTYGGALPGAGDQHPVDGHYRALGVGPFGGYSMAGLLDKLGQVPLLYQPGSKWMYSLATDACGALVEVISGRPFADYLHDEIFEPLGMTDTAFWVTPDKQPRLAVNYGRGPDNQLQPIVDSERRDYVRDPAYKSGGGGLVGTMADYLRFCEMLRRGGDLDGQRILGSRTLSMMTRNHLPGGVDLATLAIDRFSETANEGVGFGLGFATTLDEVAAGVPGAGDFYWGGSASTLFWVDPKEELSVVFLVQLMPSGTFNFRGELKSLVYAALVD